MNQGAILAFSQTSKKAMKHLSEGNWYPSWDSNWVL